MIALFGDILLIVLLLGLTIGVVCVTVIAVYITYAYMQEIRIGIKELEDDDYGT